MSKDSDEYKQIIEKEFKLWYDQLGLFSYSDDSFSFQLKENIKTLEWTEIRTIIGYEAYDDMEYVAALQITMQDKFAFRITTNTLGYYQFLFRLTERFPSISIDWDEEILSAEGRYLKCVLFDATGRGDAEIIKDDLLLDIDDSYQTDRILTTDNLVQ